MTESLSVDYGIVLPVEVGFDQLDQFGALYHAHFTTLVDRAVLAFWKLKGYYAGDSEFEDSFQLVREITITFDRPVRRYGTIVVHVWVERLGETSYTHGFRVLSADGAEEYAHGVRTLVKINPLTQRSAPWSDLARAILGELIRPGLQTASPS